MDRFDVTIIGAGPGGYVAAIRAAQLGLKVCLVERDAALGGCCLNVGCIPTKALLESSEHYHHAGRLGDHGVVVGEATLDLPTMMGRKDRVVTELTDGVAGLMKRNKVTVRRGVASVDGPDRITVQSDDGAVQIEAGAIILATGSEPIQLPFLPFDGERVVDSTGALSFEAVPERLAVIGAGAVGLELGCVWSRLGSKVTVIEMMPQIVPPADTQMAKTLQRALKQQGLDIRLKTRVTAADLGQPAGIDLTLEDAKGARETLSCDRVLVAVGRRPSSSGLGLEAAGVALDDGGRVKVDRQLRTSVPSIFAIGDLVVGPMLAHKAEEEGVAAAEIIAGAEGHVNYDVIPGVVYTHPELAWVGLTEAELKKEKIAYNTGRFLFRANGRAKTMNQEDGMVKILADAETDRILGVHIVGPRASDLIPEAVLALEFRASAEDLARTIHAHPTLAEAIKEAALAVGKRAIHA